MKILIAGETPAHSLEMSYHAAFTEGGHEVRTFDTREAVRRYARFGGIGYKVHQFWPVDAWLRKANKEFAEVAMNWKPDVILAFTGAEILAGTFAYLRTVIPARLAWYWADPLPNLSRYILQSLPLVDLVATYSEGSQEVFRQLGARKTLWVPFAAETIQGEDSTTMVSDLRYDLSFVGSWRPEREKALAAVMDKFPALRYKVNGPYWNRATHPTISKIASAKPLFGPAFRSVVRTSRINLNVMDNTNYPSANMRFFEILTAGGFELSSDAPEMRELIRHGEHLMYFRDAEELTQIVGEIMAGSVDTTRIATEGRSHALTAHLYRHRAEAILQALS